MEELEDRCIPHGGVTQFAIPTPNSAPAGIVQGPDGNFWFAEFGADRIGRTTRDGQITEFAVPGAGSGPLNITVGPDGALWFTQNGSDQIGRITTAGTITEFTVPGAGSAPNDIAAGPDGALWFTQTGSDQIGRITTAGVVTEFAVLGAGSAPGGITAGSDGALWFTQAGSGQIGRITTAGLVTEFTIPVPANGMSDPEDIVLGPGGNLFFTDFGRDQIGRITPSGQITQFNLQTGRGPQQIVAAPDGNLYFTEAASGRIGRLPASALAQGRPTSGTPPLEEFDFIAANSVPLGIALDGSDDIWFTLNAGNAVGTFAAHLQQITIAATGPVVQVFDIHLNEVSSFLPFPGYTGPLNVAVQDMNGNGVPDSIVSVGFAPGALPAVRVFDGSDNGLIAQFFVFPPFLTGGISLGSDDVNGDGRADIIAAYGTAIKVIDGTKLNQVGPDFQIQDSALLGSFFAFPFGFGSSVSLAAGDINRDGRAEIIVGAGPGALPIVKVIDGSKLNQLGPDLQIADSALLGAFFAFTPFYTGGVNVAVAFNISQRDIIVSTASGLPLVRLIDGTKLNQLGADFQIADSALLGAFFAFTPFFNGGVRVAADDINNDGTAEIIVSTGAGALPIVRVVDGTKLNQLQATGEIADSAMLDAFFTGDARFLGGVNIAADADHRDGPIFGPPGITVTNSRRDINDVFIFQSPANPANTVLAMTVSPFSTTTTPAVFDAGVLYDFRISNRDLVNTTDDLVFRVNFSNADANGVQDVVVRALPAAKFAGSGGVLVKGLTRQNTAVRGVGGTGAQFRAAEQDDPFLFDAAGFNRLLDGRGLSNGTTAAATSMPVANRPYPSGTSNAGAGDSDADGLGFDPAETPDYNAPNFFANANTLAMVLEVPSTVVAGVRPGTPLVADQNEVGFWGRAEFGGVQIDRMGRPAINTAIIPPIPRGPNNPIVPGTDMRNAFNAGHPRDDRATFGTAAAGIIAAVYPIGGNGQAPVVANLLLPDILVYDPTSNAGFFGDTVGTLGQPDFFLAGGRKFSDDVVAIEVSVLTDPDTPFNPAMASLITTQNVPDDNGLNLTDGSVVGPGAGALTGMTRTIMFPYIGARNPNPSPVPGQQPPP